MKKIVLSFGLLTVSFLSFAQGPVIEPTYLPVRGTSYKQIYDTTAQALTIPTTGQNQVWDYSNKFVNITDTFRLATFHPDSTPYSQYFPEATHASFVRAPYEMGDSVYTYYLVNRDGIWSTGGFNIKNQYDTTFITSPYEYVIPSILKFNMEPINDTTKTVGFGMYGSYEVKMIQTKYKTISGVGYGSLSLPNGNYNDVLLTQELTTRIDSFFIKVGGNYVYSPFVPPTTENFNYYFFYRNNTFGSTILMMLKTDYNSTMVRYGFYCLPVDFGFIAGQVTDSTGTALSGLGNKALLFRDCSNFKADDILSIATIDSNGNYRFDSIPFAPYRILIRPNQVIHNDMLTTFYGDTHKWIDATTITTTSDTNGIDIMIQFKPGQSGLGKISGNLLRDFGFSGKAVTGDPIPGVDIIVEREPGGIIVSEGTTDLSGNYSVNLLPDGDYTLFVNIPGLDMAQTYNFKITGNQEYSELNFIYNEDSIFAPNQEAVGIIASTLSGKVSAYPNPFDQSININIISEDQDESSIEIYNVIGKLIYYKGNIIGSQNTNIDFSSAFVSGIYFVKVNSGNESSNFKVIKK